MSASYNIVAVVVTFHPKLDIFARLLDSLERQVDSIVVIDNGSDVSLSLWFKARARLNEHLISLGSNRGIAAAQNIGISWARERTPDYILLLDQDSCPALDMVNRLSGAAAKLQNDGHRLAAVGPRYLDERQNNPPPFIRIQGLRVRRQSCVCNGDVVAVDYLVASGCLIPLSALDAIGEMAEELFIDYVDIEWGLRAKNLGYQSYGVCNATMLHSLGEHPINFFGRQIPLHSPLRHYYLFRNAVWLYRQPGPPLNWKLADAWRLLLKYGFYSLFARPRLEHIRMMSLGLRHGLLGRMGALHDS